MTVFGKLRNGNSLIALLLAMVLGGCAVGPLVQHETARSVGDGNHELVGGYGNAGIVAKWNYGISENFDFGMQYESLSFGVRGKYSVINRESGGFSLAGAFGAGTSIGGNHMYFDIMTSYLTGAFEPYATARFVQVSTDPAEFRNTDTGEVAFTVQSAQYKYGQAVIGTRIWMSSSWLLSLEATSLFGLGDGVQFSENVLLGAALGYRLK